MIGLGHALSLALAPQGAGGGVVPPDVPGNFSVDARTNTSITVAWDAVPEGVTVNVEWQEAGGDWSELVGAAVAATAPLELSTPKTDTEYDIRAWTQNAAGEDSAYVELREYTLPDAPTGLAVSPDAYRMVSVTWDAQPGVNFNLYINGVFFQGPIDVGPPLFVVGSGPGFEDYFALTAVSATSGLESVLCEAVEGTYGEGRGPTNVTPPAQGGSTSEPVGTILTITDPGAWDGDPEPSISFIWQIEGFDVASQTSESCDTSSATTNNSTMRCRVTATNAVGSVSEYTNETYVYYPE